MCAAIVQKWLIRLTLGLFAALGPGCRESRAPEDAGAPLGGHSPRIVALSPGVAETLESLGLGDTLVGRHAFDDFSSPDIPAVGDQSGIDYEALLRVRPTHVLLEKSAAGAPPRLLELASARSFEVREVPMLSLDDIRGAIERLPAIVGAPDASEKAGDLLARFDAALAPAQGFDARAGRMLALYWTTPVGAAGPGSYHAEIIVALGGALALDDGAPYRQLDPEDVRRLGPDSIALFIPDADPARLDELLGALRSLELRAVREGRVALVNHPRCQTPGPSAIDVAESLRDAVLAWPPLTQN
jgi:ABC-type Fe3+-hydroxamate transport system substrate-binding protein